MRILGENLTAFFGQLANQPIRFQRIAEPRLGPAMGYAGADECRMHMLPMLVEQWKFASGLG